MSTFQPLYFSLPFPDKLVLGLVKISRVGSRLPVLPVVDVCHVRPYLARYLWLNDTRGAPGPDLWAFSPHCRPATPRGITWPFGSVSLPCALRGLRTRCLCFPTRLSSKDPIFLGIVCWKAP